MEKNENNDNLNNYEEEEDDFAKSLEKDLEESTKLYINNITTNSPYKSDTELLLLSKEEIKIIIQIKELDLKHQV